MPSPPRPISRPKFGLPGAWAAASLALALGACDLLSGVPAGSIVGEVDYDGRPAPGITVALWALTGGNWVSKSTISTDVAGTYRFSGLAGGTFQVRFSRAGLESYLAGHAEGLKMVSEWSSPYVSLGLGGSRLAAFDVAYDGLIYPESGKSSSYSALMGLPFHWSSHRNASSYRVRLYDISGGKTPLWKWDSDWTANPVIQLTRGFPPGNYQWKVTLDGGSAGTGSTEVRNVDLDFQEAQPAS